MREHSQRGFSLTELVLSVFILALALIFIIAVFTKMLAATSKGADMTVATYLAQSELDRMLNDPVRLRDIVNNTSGDLYAGAYNLAYTTDFTDSLNRTTYYFQITARPLISDPHTTERQLYYVEANVYWWGESPDAVREGLGKTSLRLSRLYYLRD